MSETSLTYENMLKALEIFKENSIEPLSKLKCGECGLDGDTGNIVIGIPDLCRTCWLESQL